MLSFTISRGSLISSNVFNAISHAFSNPSAIYKGWSPLSINWEAYSNKAPASTTTEVVPSPISSSWDLDSSTNNFATGCYTSIYSSIVAPSFVTKTF